MRYQDIEQLFSKIQNKKIMVIGDIIVDRYVIGSVERISPEAPVPVVYVTSEDMRGGGAANVALNIASLGGKAILVGMVGDDYDGEKLMDFLRNKGMDTSGIVKTRGIRTCVKTRIVADRQHVVRIDVEEDDFDRMKEAREKLADIISSHWGQCDGIILEDYGKGVFEDKVVECISDRMKNKEDVLTGYDPKEGHPLRLSGYTVVTPNLREALSFSGMHKTWRTLEERLKLAELSGSFLLKKWNARYVIVTLSDAGMLVVTDNSSPVHIPTTAREVADVCGAGDTVIAAVVLALSGGVDVVNAASFANCAAGVVVGKFGTSVCTKEEVIKWVKNNEV